MSMMNQGQSGAVMPLVEVQALLEQVVSHVEGIQRAIQSREELPQWQYLGCRFILGRICQDLERIAETLCR